MSQAETTVTKKYNINKQSPFDEYGIDVSKLMNSPKFIKLINGANNIENVNPIYISNLSEEKYQLD